VPFWENPAHQNPEDARFTPQQAEDSPVARISTRIDPASSRRYRLRPILGKTPTAPKNSEGQVHPTASRRLPCSPNINPNRSCFIPEVPSPAHFGKDGHSTQKLRRPGSPHSKQKTPLQPEYQPESILLHPGGTVSGPFWERRPVGPGEGQGGRDSSGSLETVWRR
jgi:hypothetical protein